MRTFWFGDETDPRILLLDELFSQLPLEKQVDLISTRLDDYNPDAQDLEALLPFIKALEHVYGNEVIAFRKKLQSVYRNLWDSTTVWSPSTSFVWTLHLALLDELLEGWKPDSPDKEDCFAFLCHVYGQHIEGAEEQCTQLRGGILDLLRKHLDANGAGWTYEELEYWIVYVWNDVSNRKKDPAEPRRTRTKSPRQEDILTTLLHAQIRLPGGAFTAGTVKTMIATTSHKEKGS